MNKEGLLNREIRRGEAGCFEDENQAITSHWFQENNTLGCTTDIVSLVALMGKLALRFE